MRDDIPTSDPSAGSQPDRLPAAENPQGAPAPVSGTHAADVRIEHDTMGEVRVPADALYRAQTQRAIDNFPVSGTPLDRDLVIALAWVKRAAAGVNAALDRIPADAAQAIEAAASAIISGRYPDQFPIHVHQTGPRTSTNMHMNEVLSTTASPTTGRDADPNPSP